MTVGINTDVVIIIMSGIFTRIGVILLRRSAHLMRNGKRTTGVITENVYKHETNGEPGKYYPVVRFSTDRQEWKAKELDVGYNPTLLIGHKIEIIYDPEDISILSVDSPMALIITPRVFLISGLAGFFLKY